MMKNKSKKINTFKIIFSYLKDEKLKLFLYLMLVVLTYIPMLLSSFFWGYALEALISNSLITFMTFLILRQVMDILFYCILAVPRDLTYNCLEIKFSKNVIKDLYKKISDMPAIAFEEMGVGEFINRLTTDPERVMELLNKLVRMLCRLIVVIVVIFIAFNSSYILGLEIIIFCIIMGLISYKFFPKIQKEQENIKKYSDLQVKNATENLTGIREIKALGIKRNIEKRLFDNIDKNFISQRKIKKYETIYYNLNGVMYFL